MHVYCEIATLDNCRHKNIIVCGLIIAIVSLFFGRIDSLNNIEVYTFTNFPKHKIALHFPCQESNMFATKCMCHLKCTGMTFIV